MNTLYFGDNLNVLEKHIADESVDLVYLDPPFNSNRDHNVLFKEQSGHESPAQIKAFGDTWNWAGAMEAWERFYELCPNAKVIELMHGFHDAIGENDVMAYLVMMAPRLYQLHRVLKPTGSLYLHCDSTASGYLRLILDCLFSPKNFQNEIIWKRTSSHNDAKRRYGRVSDTIYYFTKSYDQFTFNVQYTAHSDAYLEKFYRFVEEGTGRRYSIGDLNSPHPRPNLTYDYKGYSPHANGWRISREKMEKLDAEGRLHFPTKPTGRIRLKRFLDEMPGTPVSNVWTDILPVQSQSKERLGYPTQKPISLLERIISTSSNPGDLVLDPFCGCGTAIVAAHKLDGQWIGVDITPIAVSLVQQRLFDSFGAIDIRHKSKSSLVDLPTFAVEGLPTDMAGARLLYEKDSIHKDFEMWAVGLVPAIPQEKKGADFGIDGVAYFQDNPKKPSKAVVQVKGGHVTAAQIRDLRGVMAREKAQLGFFITLEPPTQAMKNEAAAAGYYQPTSGVGRRVESIQIRTIEELLEGRMFDFPLYRTNVSFKEAERLQKEQGQGEFEL
ncbi:MAG: DNA methyltransferase [Armatimonadetes bacterium]|nr:DNA methyltransferase [Armatimonadota bacterium]